MKEMRFSQNSINLSHKSHTDIDGCFSHRTTKLFIISNITSDSVVSACLEVIGNVILAAPGTPKKSSLIRRRSWLINIRWRGLRIASRIIERIPLGGSAVFRISRHCDRVYRYREDDGWMDAAVCGEVMVCTRTMPSDAEM
jgi:hypothetical protein